MLDKDGFEEDLALLAAVVDEFPDNDLSEKQWQSVVKAAERVKGVIDAIAPKS